MSTVKHRKALRNFLGEEHFRRLVADFHNLKRLRHWQEQRLEQFSMLNPEFDANPESLANVLRICEIHGDELRRGQATTFHGSSERVERHARARRRLFPHAGLSQMPSSNAAEEQLPTWLCDHCLTAEREWKAEQQPWLTLADISVRREGSHVGIPISDLQQVVQLIESAGNMRDKRILSFRLYSDGHLVVMTGEQPGPLSGSGDRILLRKDAAGWVIVESGIWAS